jgi:hypothetical protein
MLLNQRLLVDQSERLCRWKYGRLWSGRGSDAASDGGTALFL